MRLSLDESCRLGMGVDSILQQARGEAIEFSATSDSNLGQTTEASFLLITEQQQLLEALDVSVSASVRYGMASADARMDFAQRNAVNESSVYLMLSAKALNSPQHMISPRLRDAANALAEKNPSEFRQVFGDSYIDEVWTGGSLAILYMFRTRDEASKQDLSAKLNASVGGFMAGGEVSGSFHKTVEAFSASSSLSITAFISGGRGILNPSELTQSIDLYKSFPAAVLGAGVPYQVTAKPWREFPLPAGPTEAEVMVQRETIETCGRSVIRAIQSNARIQYILDNPQQFEHPDLPALVESRSQLHTAMARWATAARECNRDIKKCSMEGLEFPLVTWPQRIQTADPLGAKLAEIRLHDRRAWAWVNDHTFPGEPLDQQFDTDKRRDGRWRIALNPQGAELGGLYWTPETGAHVVYGGIFAKYQAMGGCTGPLGYPVTDEENFDNAARGYENDRCQTFEHGFLWWDAETSKVSNQRPLMLEQVLMAWALGKK